MKNKLFLSLSLLTMAFSVQATYLSNNTGIMLNQTLKAMIPTIPGMFIAESFPYRFASTNASKLVQSAKSFATPTNAIRAGKAGFFAALIGSLYNQNQKDQAQAELNKRAEKLAKAKMIGAQFAEEKANIEAGVALQSTRMQRIKNALNNAGLYVANTRAANALVQAGSVVKSNVKAHPYISTGAGLAAVAGLSYAAYNKFGKAKTVTSVVVPSTPVKTSVASKPKVSAKATTKYGYKRK